MTDDAVDTAIAALDEIAERAGVDVYATVVRSPDDDADSRSLPDKKGRHHLTGGFYGLGLMREIPSRSSGSFAPGRLYFRQRFVNYDRILTDDEAEKIKTALSMKRAERKLIVVDEVGDFPSDIFDRIYGKAPGGGRLIVDVPR
jgi:hypothetical protein